MSNNVSVTENYDFKELINSDEKEELWLCHSKTEPEQIVSIKCMSKKALKGKEDLLMNEIEVLKKLEHPNIVKLIEVLEDETRFHLVTELVSGGEVIDRIIDRGSYTEKDARDLFRQLLEGVDYLHTQGVVHRDLKPEHLLYRDESPDSKIVISDFGLSASVNVDSLSTVCGSPGYVAPEILKAQSYGKEVDVWSLGVIVYILLCGYPPFYDENDGELFRQIANAEYEFDSPYWDDISEAAKDFISGLLCKEPEKRPSCKEAMNHQWISGDAAYTKDIHASVSEQIKKNFAKSKWKRAFNATSAVRKMQMFSAKK